VVGLVVVVRVEVEVRVDVDVGATVVVVELLVVTIVAVAVVTVDDEDELLVDVVANVVDTGTDTGSSPAALQPMPSCAQHHSCLAVVHSVAARAFSAVQLYRCGCSKGLLSHPRRM
jgi:hypothetical protein